MGNYTRTYNPQPTQRVGSAELKAEFSAIETAFNTEASEAERTLRQTGGSAVNALPNAASRALKVLSFDASGHPRATIAETDLAAAVTAASNAAASASSASTSASTATTQAATATTQAGIATTQATNAAASYDAFDDRYLGNKSSNPTLDNDGAALLTGALYFNTVSNEMRVYTGSAWVSVSNTVSSDAAAASALAASTSATTATTQASNASTSATNAASSASAASTSATNAASSATSASGSASSASTSASTATTQASNASTSASAASTSATNAASSATSASGSATAAAGSATSASGSATTATTQASNASTSATNAASSATAAAGSATSASTSAGTATTQAGIATTQAGIATTKAAEAAASAASIAGGPVTSVAGKTGVVTLAKADVGLGNVDNTSDANKPVSTATQTALNAKEATITAGTTAQYYRGDKSWQTLDKTAVGLGNVDNTSDANKPVSTATQTALNAKQATLVSGTSIKTVNSTSLLGSGDVAVQPTLVSGTNIKTIGGVSILGSGDMTVGGIPSLTRSARTSNTILGTADKGTLIDITSGTFTQTLTAAATLASGWWCYLTNTGTGTVTVDPNASETIGGVTTATLRPGDVWLIVCTGTAFDLKRIGGGTLTILTSGTSYTVEAGVTRIYVECWGGGGGGPKYSGSGLGSGGGGGGYVAGWIAVTPGQSVTYGIGSGGTGATSAGSNGTAGGATTFGSYTANGGALGNASQAYGVRAGGTASGGDVISKGGPGLFLNYSGSNGNISIGGASPLGGSGGSVEFYYGQTFNANTPSVPGGGGASGTSEATWGGNSSGQNGANGEIRIRFI